MIMVNHVHLLMQVNVEISALLITVDGAGQEMIQPSGTLITLTVDVLQDMMNISLLFEVLM